MKPICRGLWLGSFDRTGAGVRRREFLQLHPLALTVKSTCRVTTANPSVLRFTFPPGGVHFLLSVRFAGKKVSTASHAKPGDWGAHRRRHMNGMARAPTPCALLVCECSREEKS